MTDMSETPVEQTPIEVPVTAESAPTEVLTAAAPEKKRRGRKPKVALAPPAPVPVLIETHKPRKRRTQAWANKTDRAFSAALAATEKERAKCIDELSKIMEMWDVKQARLKSLDWKISNLKGTTAMSAIAGMQLQSYAQPPHPQMPATYGNYPAPLPNYTPPSMRQPTLPIEPRASGGAEGIVDDGQNEDPDQFLRVGGVVGDGKWLG